MAMVELEFEQKYVLDQRKADIIVHLLSAKHGVRVLSIRQFYDGNGSRYRLSADAAGSVAKKENKKSLKLGTAYSVSIEEKPTIITLDEFEQKWKKSKHRLSKTRYEFAGTPVGHTVMVDFFLRPGDQSVYAIVAEVETLINAETKTLFLELDLPIYLRPLLLKTVDARDPSAKVFKSANMTEEHITAIERALEQLYESA